MYESYFGLTERPFSIAPDPDYLYMSSRHKEAMAHLTYGLSQGGCFIVLTGEVGTGKTTLCRNLLTDLPNNVDVALILNANLGSTELLQTVCDELRIRYKEKASQKQLLDQINRYLLKTYSENRHTVLIIDEAQLLKRNVLEQIRLLTNLETTKSKLLQIILIGQPELYDLLSRNDLRQLAQRVTARYHLGALARREIEEYVNCRLSVAGCKQPLFSRQALNKLHALTGGIPRKINVLADQALLATYSQNKVLVDAKTVANTAKEVFIATKPASAKKKSSRSRSKRSAITPWHWLTLVCVVIGLNMIYSWYKDHVADDHTDVSVQYQPLPDQSLEYQAVDGAPSVTPGRVVFSESYLTADDELAADLPVEAGASGFNEDTSLGRVLDVSGDVTGRITVLRALASQWGVQLPSKLINSVCSAVESYQLKCLSVKKWSSLLAYNRPAVVLLNHKGRKHRVIVRSLKADVATLVIGTATAHVSMQEIEQRWGGAGLVFWRPTLPDTPFLKKGDNGESIALVRLQLNEALSNAQLDSLLEFDNVLFDQDMSDKVALLQETFALSGDGLIGNETYLLMNELINSDVTPVLRKRNPVGLN